MTRRVFHRVGEAERRQDLITATLDCIAEFGIQGATVRQIAMRAGVIRLDRQRRAQETDRHIEVADLKSHDADVVQRAEMRRFQFQHLLVSMHRPGELTPAMARQPRLEQCRDLGAVLL